MRQITVKARLARYRTRSETCDLLAGPVIDPAAHIRILDAETGEVLARGLGQAEAVQLHRNCQAGRSPALRRHSEEWVNSNGTYTVVDVYHYDPT